MISKLNTVQISVSRYWWTSTYSLHSKEIDEIKNNPNATKEEFSILISRLIFSKHGDSNSLEEHRDTYPADKFVSLISSKQTLSRRRTGFRDIFETISLQYHSGTKFLETTLVHSSAFVSIFNSLGKSIANQSASRHFTTSLNNLGGNLEKFR